MTAVALSLADQAVQAVTVTTGGTPASYLPGDVLPAAAAPADLAVRAELRRCGLLRAVMSATAAADFTAAASALGTAAAAHAAAHTKGTPPTGKPVVSGPGGDVPVVANY